MLSTLSRRTLSARPRFATARASLPSIRRYQFQAASGNYPGTSRSRKLPETPGTSTSINLNERQYRDRVRLLNSQARNFLYLSSCARKQHHANGHLYFVRGFHSSRPNRGIPIIAAVLGGLKVSNFMICATENWLIK
jgi:hypothetical protein